MIGFILPSSSEWDGGLNYFFNIIDTLVENGYANRVVLFCYAGSYERAIDRYGTSLIIDSLGRYSPITSLARLVACYFFSSDFLIQSRVDYFNVKTLFYGSEPIARLSCRKYAWIADLQHLDVPKNFGLIRRVLRDLVFINHFKHANRVVVSSHDVKRKLAEHYTIDAFSPVIYVLRFRVKVSYVLQDGLTVAGLCKKNFFLCPMQLHPHKNQIHLLQAFRRLARGCEHEVKLVFSGSGYDHNSPLYQQLLSYVTENHLENSVMFLGRVNERTLQALVKRCTAVVSASEYEGWSTVVEEARAFAVSGLIVTDLSVHKEQLEGEPAIFFKPGDIEGLAHALGCFLHASENAFKLNQSGLYLCQRKTFESEVISFFLDS